MNKNTLTLGSLFSGSGGFELSGILAGIKPIWASEVAPFPIRVTTKRLPRVKHYGDINKLKGSEIEPVDIITGGFPCQSVSIAGLRHGIKHVDHGDGTTTRSGLFYEMIRIIKEMRCATNDKYPRYIVAENVQGLFSSNKGDDFRTVLEEICKVKADDISVPKCRKWLGAGEIVGDGYSVAWRTLDAAGWGIPQRRKRIFLVADFAGQSAGKILFESEGMSGYSAESFKSWQNASRSAESSTGETSKLCLNDQGGSRMDVTDGVAGTLRAEAHHPPCVMDAAGFCMEHSAKSRSIGYQKETSPTLREGVVPATLYSNHAMDARYTGPLSIAPTISTTYGTGGNNVPLVMNTFDIRLTSEGTRNARQNVYETDTSRTLDTADPTPDRNQGGLAVVETHAYGICSKHSHSMQSDNPESGFYEADTARTLDTSNQCPAKNQGGIAVVAIEGNGTRPSHKGNGYSEENVSYTLNATEKHSVAYGIDRATYNMGQNAQFDIAVKEEVEPTIVAKGPGAVAHPVYTTSKNSYHTRTEKDVANTLVATDYKDPPTVLPEPYYIVRRLTPTECLRLMGLPDHWCDNLGTENSTEEELEFWRDVFRTDAEINGKKMKSDNMIRKWLRDPYSDSAVYSLCGNGVCINVVYFVLSGIVWAAEMEGENAE